MKKFLLTLAMLALCTAAFAQRPDYDVKAEKLAKETTQLVLDMLNGADKDVIIKNSENLGEKFGTYLEELNAKSDDDLMNFITKYNDYVHIHFKKIGLGSELADQFLKQLYESVMNEFKE